MRSLCSSISIGRKSPCARATCDGCIRRASDGILASRLREEHPEIERVILFGSFASGVPGPRSDLDLVVIVADSPLPPRERVAHYAPVSPRPVDLFVYTVDEVAHTRSSTARPVLREALDHGIDLL